MEPSYNMQDGHWKGTSYLSLILKTDVGLGRNSLPSYIFFSFSDQILFIAVNRNFSGADGFRRPCQEDGFSLSLLPAPPVLEFPVAEAVNSHIVQRKEAEMETRRRSPRQVSCVAAARSGPCLDQTPQRCSCRGGGRHPRRRLAEQPPEI